MIVALISDDQRLYELCRAILTELSPEIEHQLFIPAPSVPLPSADVYIWDRLPELDVALRLATEELHRHIFLIDRSDLEGAGAPLRGAMLVLRPVTKAALAAWLEQAETFRAEPFPQSANGKAHTVALLADANLRLQECDQDRTSFLARVMHDFRAPLTATNGYCGLLLAGELGPLTDIQKEVLTRTQNSLKRLARMTSAMFHLAVGWRVPRVPNLKEGDIRECVEQAIHETQPLAIERRIQVTTELTPSTQAIYFDPEEVLQVLTNLLENACKFASKGGRIDVRGYPHFWERRSASADGLVNAERRRGSNNHATPNAFRFDVSNTGPAIIPERLSRIFDEYTSFGGPEEGGTGLGLAICKLIVQQHRGRIWAENHAAGPVISFVLPVERAVFGSPLEGAHNGAHAVHGGGQL
jgi:signal transduction histidine kinase